MRGLRSILFGLVASLALSFLAPLAEVRGETPRSFGAAGAAAEAPRFAGRHVWTGPSSTQARTSRPAIRRRVSPPLFLPAQAARPTGARVAWTAPYPVTQYPVAAIGAQPAPRPALPFQGFAPHRLGFHTPTIAHDQWNDWSEYEADPDDEDESWDEDEDWGEDDEEDYNEDDSDEEDDEDDENSDDEDEDDEEEEEDEYQCGLHDVLTPYSLIEYGGWFHIGYHSNNVRLSQAFNDQLAYNDRPDRLNLHQAWIYFEKPTDADMVTADWGFRVDGLYGIDGQDTQSFGNENNVWDVSFDHGAYGWALPQAYLEIAYGEWAVWIGRFGTFVGYEATTAPDNFFYSRSLSMFNSEPYGHTGVLAMASDDEYLTFYAGWTLGWDTGFDQFGGGNNLLAGFTLTPRDGIELTYGLMAGNFGFQSADRSGYANSLALAVDLSEQAEYGLHSCYVSTNGFAGDPTVHAEDLGVTQYLYYELSDRVTAGGRAEWWKSNTVTGTAASFYELTGGLNLQADTNLVIRPEVRYDWTPSQAGIGGDYNGTTFGVDAVLTF